MTLIMVGRRRGNGIRFYEAELPRAAYFPSYSLPTGTVRTVASGGDLQATFDAAADGDVIVLDNGATWAGAYTLAKSVYLLSAAIYNGTGVAAGVRATSTTGLPTIQTSSTAAALTITASNVRVAGLHFTCTATTGQVLVRLGTQNGLSDSFGDFPSSVCVDRCVFTGTSGRTIRRQLQVNGSSICVRDSAFYRGWGPAGANQDSQNIWIASPSQDVVVDNCYCEGASEPIFIGNSGDGPNLRDLTIRRSYCTHLSSGQEGRPKNLLETKGGVRVLIEDMVFGYHLCDGGENQQCVVLKSNDNARLHTDVVIRNCRVLDALGFLTLVREGTPGVDTDVLDRVVVRHVLVEAMTRGIANQREDIVRVLANVTDLRIEHVTALAEATDSDPAMVRFDTTDTITNPRINNNVFFAAGGVGVQTNVSGTGFVSNSGYVTAQTAGTRELAGNLLIGASSSDPDYAAYGTNAFPTAVNASNLFVDYAARDLRIKSDSPFVAAGVGGVRPGADIDTILTRTAGCVSGSW